MKTFNIIKGLALVCAVSLYACSESNEIPEETLSLGKNVKEVGDNEYVVTVGASGNSNESRGIQNGRFDDVYDPDKIYVHSMTGDAGCLTLNVKNGAFSYRIKMNDDGTFTLSNKVDEPVSSDSGAQTYSEIYFSSWTSDTWEGIMDDSSIQVDGNGTTIKVMEVEDRTSKDNWREIYRSENNYTGNGLLSLTALNMDRVVAGYGNTVIFTDFENGEQLSVDRWKEIITDPHGDEPRDWGVTLYLGNFPTTYNFIDNSVGEGRAYYSSSENIFKECSYSVGVSTTTGVGMDTMGEEHFNYLCTPTTLLEKEYVNAYIVIRNVPTGKKYTVRIEHFDEGDNYCVPTPNNIEQLVSIFDVRDLGKAFGMIPDENAVGVSINVPASRALDSDFELKPRKVIRVKL